MTPEDVLAALAAHSASVEFRRPDPLVEEASIAKRGKARPGNWRAMFGAGDLPSIRSAIGRDHRRVSTTARHEAAADALSNMPKRSWQALQTAIGADMGARDAVIARLMKEAWRSQQRDPFWPANLNRRPCRCRRAASANYTEDLVQLAVLQLEDPFRFATHDARANWFGLSNAHWRRAAQAPYELLSGRVWHWYHAGIGHIERRLARRRRERV